MSSFGCGLSVLHLRFGINPNISTFEEYAATPCRQFFPPGDGLFQVLCRVFYPRGSNHLQTLSFPASEQSPSSIRKQASTRPRYSFELGVRCDSTHLLEIIFCTSGQDFRIRQTIACKYSVILSRLRGCLVCSWWGWVSLVIFYLNRVHKFYTTIGPMFIYLIVVYCQLLLWSEFSKVTWKSDRTYSTLFSWPPSSSSYSPNTSQSWSVPSQRNTSEMSAESWPPQLKYVGGRIMEESSFMLLTVGPSENGSLNVWAKWPTWTG